MRSIFRIDSTSPNGPFFINERKGCEVSVPAEKAVEKFRICMAMQFARAPEAQKLSVEVKSECKERKEKKKRRMTIETERRENVSRASHASSFVHQRPRRLSWSPNFPPSTPFVR